LIPLLIVQLAAYVVAIREMWVAGELDLNALLVAEGGDGRKAGAAMDPAASSSDAPSSAADEVPIYSEAVDTRSLYAAPTIAVPIDAPIFDPLGMSGADAFFASLAAASASSHVNSKASSGSYSRLDSKISSAETLGDAATTPLPRGRRSHTQCKTSDDDAHAHPVVDEDFLMGAIAAADAAAASARASATSSGGAGLTSTRSSQSRAFSTVSGPELPDILPAPELAVDVVPLVSSTTAIISPSAGLPDFELPGSIDPHPAAVDAIFPPVKKLDLCPRTTPIEALIVRLDKSTGAVDVQRVTDIDASFRGFLAALQLHRLLKPQAQNQSKHARAAAQPASLLERVEST